jgi:adenine-specific DNA-methyltransferase
MKKELAQYFTTNHSLLLIIKEFIKNKSGNILEPSVGAGHIVEYLINNGEKRLFTCLEIDKSINFLPIMKNKSISIFKDDFLNYNFNKKYKTIVGNPPYIKRKGKCNLYIDFINKCIDLLEDNGELIFVIPSDFFKLTSASYLKNKMLNNGSITHVYYPQKENYFKKANQDIIIFRYEKNNKTNIVLYNNIEKYIELKNGNIYIKNLDEKNKNTLLSSIFAIKVGMISGLNSFFKNDLYGNELIKTSNGDQKYILINSFPENKELINYFENHKEQLFNRKIIKINDNNWYKWGCLRNIEFMKRNIGKECIYCSVLTRKTPVFFKGIVMYYDGSLLCLLPKKNIDIDYYLNLLNSHEFLQHFLYSGRYKIGQKSLSDINI